MTRKDVAPPADEDVVFPPRIAQVIAIIADSIAENIRREANTEAEQS